jgi:hypothetical protein
MNLKKIAKVILRDHGINVRFDVNNNRHVWMIDADREVNINIAVGRNRGYSQTGRAASRIERFALDDARRYAARKSTT